jgi:hypothetical protein
MDAHEKESLELIVRSAGTLSVNAMLPCGMPVGVFVIEHVLMHTKKSRNFYDYKPPRNLLPTSS